MSETADFKRLPVWQHAMQFVLQIYQLAQHLPATERQGLGLMLQTTAISLPTTIAAGTKRGRTGFRDALLDCREAVAGIETQLILCKNLYPDLVIEQVIDEAALLQATLTTMAKRLVATAPSHKTAK